MATYTTGSRSSRRYLSLIPHPTGSPTPNPGRLQLLPPTLIVAEGAEDGDELSLSDLNDFADALASEFHYDRGRAIWEPSLWYRAQVGDEICTEEQAKQLRQMTIDRCGRIGRHREQIEADFQASADGEIEPWDGFGPPPQRQTAAQEAADGLGLMLSLLAIVAIIVLIGMAKGGR